jgi:hypothetical protein
LHHDLKDESYRLFPCGRCNTPVCICRGCDRGNRYCLRCVLPARHESLKRARIRYQNTIAAKRLHCLRQKDYRQRQRTRRRQNKQLHRHDLPSSESDVALDILPVDSQANFAMSSVTDHGSPLITGHGIVMATAITRSHRQSKSNDSSGKVQCNMCGAWCGPFARRGWWHRGRRWTNRQGGKP